MQTPIATACPSGSLSDNVRSGVEADLDHVVPFENETLSSEDEREEALEWVTAMAVSGFVAATVTPLPPALRF